MKKFLSVIEGIFREGVLIVGKLIPFTSLFPTLFPAGQILNTIATDIKLAITEIINVSSIINTPGEGAARLAAATPRIAAIFTTAVEELGLHIADEQGASKALTQITSGMADFINACKKK
jgi:hypothetical protein